MCAYINSKWCNNDNIHVTDRTFTPHTEVLSLSILPREFPKINLNVVYIPPQANARQAEDHITSLVHDSIVVITGDFNHCTLGTSLPTLHQYVTCPTRNNKTLDVCYGNVKDGYQSSALPPSGDSDHSMVHLIHKFKIVLKSYKPVKKIVTSKSHQNIEDLCGCLECTDWGVFLESCDDLTELNDHVTGYIKFCEVLICPEKNIKCYPNNKPWITKEVKDIITRKRVTFISGDKAKLKSLQKELRDGIRKCREKFRVKLEANLSIKNCKATWEIMKAMAGMNKKKNDLSVDEDIIYGYAKKLNAFYVR